MNDIEILIALVAAAIVLVRIADAISIPYPIVLVLGGLAIGFIPGGPTLELQPDVVFLVFLPPLLQSAGYWSSPKELRAELVPLTWLVIGLTLATMVAVAAIAQAVIPSISWAEGFVLGAIVAPTDPVSAIATFQRVGVTDRVATLVEGESMVNDAVALVSYKVAVVAVVSGTLTAGEAVDDLVVGVIGGVAIGLAVSGIAQMALRRLDDAPLAILLTVFTAYASFALADGVGASGVLAAVSSGLFSGWRSHIIFDADLRLNAQSFWRVLVFALNAILFVLVGEQFPEILRRVGETFSPGEIVGLRADGLGRRDRGPRRLAVPARLPREAASEARGHGRRRGLAREAADRLGRHARGRLPGRRPRPAAHARLGSRLRLPRPDRLPDRRGDLRDARRSGTDPSGPGQGAGVEHLGAVGAGRGGRASRRGTGGARPARRA